MWLSFVCEVHRSLGSLLFSLKTNIMNINNPINFDSIASPILIILPDPAGSTFSSLLPMYSSPSLLLLQRPGPSIVHELPPPHFKNSNFYFRDK